MNFSSKIRQDITVTELDLLSQFMLEISSGVDQITGLRWELAGCLLLAWVIVYCALWKGVKSIGKVKRSRNYRLTFPRSVRLRDGAVPLRHPADPPGPRRHAAGLPGRGRLLHHAAVGQDRRHQCESVKSGGIFC